MCSSCSSSTHCNPSQQSSKNHKSKFFADNNTETHRTNKKLHTEIGWCNVCTRLNCKSEVYPLLCRVRDTYVFIGHVRMYVHMFRRVRSSVANPDRILVLFDNCLPMRNDDDSLKLVPFRMYITCLTQSNWELANVLINSKCISRNLSFNRFHDANARR